MGRIKFYFFVLFCTGILSVNAQQRLQAFEMNKRLGKGINMGNAFEAPSETAWGNPWDPEYFRIMSELGFSHVRLPVRWEPADRSMDTDPYTIHPEFLDRIQEVVDTALKYNLHIIVNMHHHEALYEDPAGQKERFLSQWFQIADHFKDYPDSLLLEVLNEPHGNLRPEIWNDFFSDALAEIRKTNPTRIVIMGTADYGGLGGIVHLQIPDDEYLILSVHYYSPFTFTHQGADWVGAQSSDWLGTEWNDTEADRETVTSEFAYALLFSDSTHIPLHVGEFGAYERADLDSRVRWTTYLSRWFEQQDMSWAYWEFSAGFGIYDPEKKKFLNPLVDALLHNEMPEAVPVLAIPVYTADFNNGTDGWTLQNQGSATGSLTASGSKLNVSISNSGTESWHVQLIKGNIPLEKDKMYRVSFNAGATAGRSATFYVGKNGDPWNAYSGYNGISIGAAETIYTFAFTMNNPTDMASRLVFDLGLDTTDVYISAIKLEELKLMVTSLNDAVQEPQGTVYPNPFDNFFYFKNLGGYNRVEIYDMQGRIRKRSNVDPGGDRISTANLASGLYLLRLSGDGIQKSLKIVKK